MVCCHEELSLQIIEVRCKVYWVTLAYLGGYDVRKALDLLVDGRHLIIYAVVTLVYRNTVFH